MGVEESDAEVYRKQADDLIRFATGLVGPGDAADIVSEAFLSCLSSAGWMTVTDKRSYLYRIVLTVSRNSVTDAEWLLHLKGRQTSRPSRR
jgi:DNA-directed RNA polymerase specialized sigma24 family protein